MSFEPLQPHDMVLIVGKRGSGKSTHAKALIAAELKRRGSRVVVFDYHDEYSQKGRASDQVRLGPCRDRVTVEELVADPDMLDSPRLSLSVIPDGAPKACARDFEDVANLVLDTGNLTFVADEMGVYGEFCPDVVNRVGCQSRHASVPFVVVSQRMVQVPKTARTQATQLYSFRQDHPHDLNALAEVTSNEDFAAKVSRLPRGRCEVWRDSIT